MPLSDRLMSRSCVFCGRDNPAGMHMQFERTPTGVVATVRPREHFQGFAGVLHGGVVCGLLDEAMWWAIYTTRDVITMTVDISVRYRKPVPVDGDLRAEGTVEAVRDNRVFLAKGRLVNSAGEVLAESHAKFLAAPAGYAASLSRELVILSVPDEDPASLGELAGPDTAARPAASSTLDTEAGRDTPAVTGGQAGPGRAAGAPPPAGEPAAQGPDNEPDRGP